MKDFLSRIQLPGWILIGILTVAACYFSGVVPAVIGMISDVSNQAQSPAVSVPTLANGQPSQPQTGTTPNVDSNGQPVNPVQPGLPGEVSADGYYPGQCRPGDTRPSLNVAFDDYVGFYRVVVQYMTMSSDQYCLNLMPKWSGPNWDINGWSEDVVEEMMKRGEIDVYFGSNGALALWDSNSGRVVWTTDQSAGADAIVARNSVTTRVDPKTGLPSPNFNDALGQTACTARGSADNYFLFTALQSAAFLPGDVNIRYTDYPVDDFKAGLCTFVVYWDPIVRDAMMADTTTILTTNDWRTVSDYAVISIQADNEKEDAIVYFLAQFNAAGVSFTNENLAATAELLVTWVHDGNNMAGWLFLDPAKAAADLAQLMDGVALGSLRSNVIMFDSDLFGWNLVKDQFDKTHLTMQTGDVHDNSADNSKGSLYNSDDFISDKYVEILNKNNAVNVVGNFAHDYITDVNEAVPNLDDNTLFTLPEIMTIKHKNIAFQEGFARNLMPGEMETLLSLLQPLANQMRISPDMVIVVQGGHGLYSADQSVMDTQARLAFRRASYIKEILSDPKGLNIPINRIVVNPIPIAPTHTLAPSELKDYIVVLISVVNTGGVQK